MEGVKEQFLMKFHMFCYYRFPKGRVNLIFVSEILGSSGPVVGW